MSKPPRLIYLLNSAQRRLQQFIAAEQERAARAGTGAPSPAQSGVLFVLAKEDGATMGRLAEVLDLAPSAMSGLVQRMEAQHWVERLRQPAHRRAVLARQHEQHAALRGRGCAHARTRGTLLLGADELLQAALGAVEKEDEARRLGHGMLIYFACEVYLRSTDAQVHRPPAESTRRRKAAIRRAVSSRQVDFGDHRGLDHKKTPAMPPPNTASAASFSPYQKFVVGLLALLQFAVILDFMLMSPLGVFIMPALAISTKQFGLAVSVYAFSAGVSGFVAAGFADRFDRKKILMFFYTGFLLGTLACGLAPTYELLLAARIVTGIFGGVIGSVVLAIATDLFEISLRGRVMGLIQTAFAASQVLGLPMALFFRSEERRVGKEC